MPDSLITVESILQEKLRELGADGLCNSDAQCGCSLSDFAPCGDLGLGCRPAWSRYCWHCDNIWYFAKRPTEQYPVCGDCEAGDA